VDRVVERAGALDVHKEQVTACVRTPGDGGRRRQETREFKTTVRGLLALLDWLVGHGVTVVAMEATGVYWRPVWHVLEDNFELMLCNAAHVRTFRDARPMSLTRSGCASCWSSGCCGRASCRPRRCVSCVS
jgi:transposase